MLAFVFFYKHITTKSPWNGFVGVGWCFKGRGGKGWARAIIIGMIRLDKYVCVFVLLFSVVRAVIASM